MDINTFISSAIIPQKDDTCSVLLPSFSGFCETILYRNDDGMQSYGQEELFPHFRTNDFIHDTGIIVIASSFFGLIAVRIINTESIYKEQLFLIEEGEIFSFSLKGNSYFAFIYTDIEGRKHIETNLQNDNLFSWRFENNTFSIINSLTEMTVFEKSINIIQKKKRKQEEVLDSYTLCVVEDPFSDELQQFLETCIRTFSIHHVQNGVIHFLRFEKIPLLELSRFIGFLGKYTCILPDERLGIPGYITRKDVGDNIFSLPETFDASTQIEYLDPRWDSFRTGILELTYMEYLLEKHIELLKGGIQSIENLQSEHVLFQYKRLELTLHDAEILYPKYQSQKQILIEILRQKIS